MSSRELVARYLVERARLEVFVPLAVVIGVVDGWTGGQVVGSNGGGATALARTAATALLLMLAFRVWDDVEDRTRDSVEHPERVTVSATSLGPLVWLACALAGVGLLLIGVGPRVAPRVGALALAAAALGVWYRVRSANARGVLNGHVVLLKYPAIAFAASPRSPSFAALAALYFALCVYEIVADPRLRASIVARRVAISECALVTLIIATATFLGGQLS
jgi:4-hydroxybenzoate polyprenyltransferase